jgi:spermidine dehydrogenase
MSERHSDDLGMKQPITRRDFVNGVAVGTALGATLLSRGAAATEGSLTAASSDGAALVPGDAALLPRNYPPASTGLRGQYPGSFETAHAVRDGRYTDVTRGEDTGEHYDLVVVGGGISGLATAYFFRQALGNDRRILILDNHDDFGGHAKRNEFHYNGRTYLGFGGTMSIETPFPYSYTAKALLKDLGIDSGSFARYHQGDLYKGLTEGIFFDREHFADDKVVPGVNERPWREIFEAAPLSARVRADLTRLHSDRVDFLPQLDPAAKAQALKRMSYQDFLLKHAHVLPESMPFFAGVGFRNNMRVDTCPAFVAARSHAAGFDGMNIAMGDVFESDVFHFPDGNASIARLLVSALVPGAFSGPQTQESIVTALANYDALDLSSNMTRIRLKSTAVHVSHVGSPGHADTVRVIYVRDGKQRQVTGGNVVMACFNNIIRFLVPDLPADQQQALAYASKVPMQYTNVLVRNWEPWRKLGVSSIQAPNGYHTWVALDIPVSIGRYRFPSDPREPVVVHMMRNPNKPGLPRKEQHRAGRADMLATAFEKIESEIRSQLARMLGPAGFDPARDILGITVNRWPHGYAYTYDTLGDPELPEAERPHVLGRRAFGRIAIANADAGAAAFTNEAIDQAERAVQDCLSSRGLV